MNKTNEAISLQAIAPEAANMLMSAITTIMHDVPFEAATTSALGIGDRQTVRRRRRMVDVVGHVGVVPMVFGYNFGWPEIVGAHQLVTADNAVTQNLRLSEYAYAPLGDWARAPIAQRSLSVRVIPKDSTMPAPPEYNIAQWAKDRDNHGGASVPAWQFVNPYDSGHQTNYYFDAEGGFLAMQAGKPVDHPSLATFSRFDTVYSACEPNKIQNEAALAKVAASLQGIAVQLHRFAQPESATEAA